MAYGLEKYDKLVTAILVIVIFVFAIGWWFAEEKSDPVYLSKIDKLMFDKNNKAPKLVLTLPDKLKEQSKKSAVSLEVPKVIAEKKIVQEIFSLEEMLAGVPNIAGLPNTMPTIENKYIEASEDLVEKTEDGKTYPKISDDGQKPWIEYSNIVQVQPNFKKVALVISNLGMDVATAKKIATAFPSEVSISLTPYSLKAYDVLTGARTSGHETYVDVPLASKDFLYEDTGPLALNFNLSAEITQERFHKIIDKPAPFGGLIIRDGALYDSKNIVLQNIFSEIRDRGLLVIDAVSSEGFQELKIEGLAHRKADILISLDMTQDQIEEQLKKAELIAFDKGQVLIVSDSKPFIIMALYKWIQTFSPQVSYEEAKSVELSKPFALVPVSNLVVE